MVKSCVDLKCTLNHVHACIIEECVIHMESYTIANEDICNAYPAGVSACHSYATCNVSNELNVLDSLDAFSYITKNAYGATVCHCRYKACCKAKDIAVCINICCNDLVKIIGTVKDNLTAANLNAINNKCYARGHIINIRKNVPLLSPVFVIICDTGKGDMPRNIYITVNDAADVVKSSSTHKVTVCIIDSDNEAFLCIAPNLAPDACGRGITVEVVSARKLNERILVDGAVCIKLGIVILASYSIRKIGRSCAVPVVTRNINICDIRKSLLTIPNKELVAGDANFRSYCVIKISNSAKFSRKNVIFNNDLVCLYINNLKCIIRNIANVVAGNNNITAYIICT